MPQGFAGRVHYEAAIRVHADGDAGDGGIEGDRRGEERRRRRHQRDGVHVVIRTVGEHPR